MDDHIPANNDQGRVEELLYMDGLFSCFAINPNG